MNSMILVIFVVTVLCTTPLFAFNKNNELLITQNLYSNETALKNVDLNELPAYYPLLYALQYIAFGKPDPTRPSIFELLDSADDNITLFEIIVLLSQNFNLYWTENEFDEEGFDELWKGWLELLTVFGTEGPNGVTLGMMKPYIKFLRPENLIEIYQKIRKPNDNLNNYIKEEFLSKIKNPYCRNYVGLWFQDIQKGKLWAISMFDNIGKPSTGVLTGNINWVGNYKGCRQIEVDVGNGNGFHGKYCRTTLGLPFDDLPDVGIPITDTLGINIGLCVPHQCENEDVEAISNKTLELMALHKILYTKNIVCDDEVPYSPEFITFTTLLSILCGFCVFATFFDIAYQKIYENKKQTNLELMSSDVKKSIVKKNAFVQFIIDCSLYTNSERIFRTDNSGKFTCLNGIKAITMIWIIVAHSFRYLIDYDTIFLLSNPLEAKVDVEEKLIGQFILNGMYGVDTFFLLSAFLLTYSTLNKLQKTNRFTTFDWFYYYIHRYWRLVPPYLIIFVINIYILPFVGNGPLWDTKDFPHKTEDCKNYWWSYILLINNFVPNGKGTTCMGFLWYVSNDYQLYAISPIFLFLLFKFPIAGIVLLLFTLISSVTLLALLTENVYVSQSKVILPTIQNIWGDIYIKPYCRAGPWILGIFLGYIFFKYRKVTLNKFVLIIGWITSIVLGITAVTGGYTNHPSDGRRMEIAEYGAYFSLTRVTFPLAVGWVIFACHYGYGGVINRFLSAKAFLPLTRISYCTYLIHAVIMVAYYYAQESVFNASGLSLLYLTIGHIIFSFFVAYLFTMFFELPFVALEKLVLSVIKKKSIE